MPLSHTPAAPIACPPFVQRESAAQTTTLCACSIAMTCALWHGARMGRRIAERARLYTGHAVKAMRSQQLLKLLSISKQCYPNNNSKQLLKAFHCNAPQFRQASRSEAIPTREKHPIATSNIFCEHIKAIRFQQVKSIPMPLPTTIASMSSNLEMLDKRLTAHIPIATTPKSTAQRRTGDLMQSTVTM